MHQAAKGSAAGTLQNNKALRYSSFCALYIAQGIPEGMTYFGIPAWMAANGKTPMEIGAFLGIVGIPWSFKILIAPLMDRYTFWPMGRRRPWVLAGQLGLIISFLAMAFIDEPLSHLGIFGIAGFFVSFFGAFQDVATDGMAIDLVPISEQARANGLMWGAKIAGTAASLSIGTQLINTRGFNTAIAMLSIGVVAIMLVPLLVRERPGERLLPWTRGQTSPEALQLEAPGFIAIIVKLYRAFALPASLWVSLSLFAFMVAVGLIDAVLPVFTIQEVGWSSTRYSDVFALVTLIGGVLGMLVGGFLSDYFGKKRTASVYLAIFFSGLAILALGSSYWKSSFFIPAFMALHYMLYTFICISFFAICMELSWRRISATQFTLYMAVANLGRAAGAYLLGPLKQHLSWSGVIFSVGVFALLSLLLLVKLRMQKHHERLQILERKQQAMAA